MTLDEILNLPVSDEDKIKIIKSLQKGGNLSKEQNSNIEKTNSDTKELNPTETIEIEDQKYDIEIADTEEKRMIGLKNIDSLKDKQGMLFIFDNLTTDSFTMKETKIDLDIIFIDEDKEVLEVHSVKAFDPNPIICSEPYMYVFETNINSGIKKGDELDFDDDFTEDEMTEIKKSKMLVLDSEGNVQMKLIGGERIISRIKTKQLVKAALKAYKTDNDSDYKRVGRMILKELNAQDDRPTQYVNNK